MKYNLLCISKILWSLLNFSMSIEQIVRSWNLLTWFRRLTWHSVWFPPSLYPTCYTSLILCPGYISFISLSYLNRLHIVWFWLKKHLLNSFRDKGHTTSDSICASAEFIDQALDLLISNDYIKLNLLLKFRNTFVFQSSKFQICLSMLSSLSILFVNWTFFPNLVSFWKKKFVKCSK
jgi:hypothetical protein